MLPIVRAHTASHTNYFVELFCYARNVDVCVFICNDYDGNCFLQYLGMTYLFVFVISVCVLFYVFLINAYFN